MSAKSLCVLLALAPALCARSVPLAEKLSADDCFRVQLHMRLDGSIAFQKDGKKQSLPLHASARHVLAERVLMVTRTGSPEKTARLYETAEANIKTGQHESRRTLRTDRSLIVAQWQNDQLVVYSPNGPLVRDELDLCSEHFDTLHLLGLLPGGDQSVGDTWKVANIVVQALCQFEGLTEQKLVGKLDEVKDGKAFFSVTGPAIGIDLGSLVKTTIEAHGVFDLTAKRLVKLQWKQKDERDQGPASPASSLESTTTMERSPIQQPEGLGIVALASVPEGLTVPPQMLQMEYQHPDRVYGLLYPRDWHVVAQTGEHLVMRLLERGDFVAQVTVAVWDKAPAGKHLTPAQFTEETARQEGWEPAKTLDQREAPAENGRWMYRLAQLGKLKGVEVVQSFCLVANEDGRQVALSFCMSPKQVDRLGSRDLTLAGSLLFPPQK